MDQRIKKLWVQALRGREYQQGKEYLRPTEDTFCCLGVLCDLAVKEGVLSVVKVGAELSVVKGILYYYDSEVTELPSSVCEWAGLVRGDFCLLDPIVDYKGEKRTLSDLNDKGKSFRSIADLIEEQL